MASNYTCRACIRALSRPSSLIPQTTPISRPSTLRKLPQPHRNASTTTQPTPKPTSKPTPQQPTRPSRPPPADPKELARRADRELRKKMPKGTLSSSSYVVYTLMDKLIEECTKQGAYTIPQARQRGTPIPTDENGAHIGVASGWWYDTLGLQPTFINWSQITFIHVWMLQVRFRMFPEEHAQIYIQHLTNHVFYVAEDQLVVWHNLNSASLRQKFLKDMFAQWRAVLLSYDEALVKGDAVLAAAVWRNLLASREDVDFEKVAQIVAYMRWGLRKLESMTDEEVANDLWEFERDPGMESEAVGRQSPGMRLSDKQASA